MIAGDGVLSSQLNITIWSVLSDLWTVRANCCPSPLPSAVPTCHLSRETLQSMPNKSAWNQRVLSKKMFFWVKMKKVAAHYHLQKNVFFQWFWSGEKIYFQDECVLLINYATNIFPLEVPRPIFAWNNAAFSFFNGMDERICWKRSYASAKGELFSLFMSVLRCSAGGAIYRTVSSICSELETEFEDSLA